LKADFRQAQAEMNMDLDLNPADFQLCDGFGMDLDFINSA